MRLSVFACGMPGREGKEKSAYGRRSIIIFATAESSDQAAPGSRSRYFRWKPVSIGTVQTGISCYFLCYCVATDMRGLAFRMAWRIALPRGPHRGAGSAVWTGFRQRTLAFSLACSIPHRPVIRADCVHGGKRAAPDDSLVAR